MDEGETDPLLADTDGDGLADGIEDSNGNGQVDEGELDPLNADSDNGGESDGNEVIGNRNPLDRQDDLRLLRIEMEMDWQTGKKTITVTALSMKERQIPIAQTQITTA